MTQTTFYSDKKLFASFYKSTLSRLKGVTLLYGILMFITYPMFYFISVGNAMERLANGQKYYGFEGYADMYVTAAIFFFAVIVGAVISLCAISNSFMHGKKSVDVFHALPVRRPVMLVANFAAVMTMMFITEAVCYLAVGVVSAFTIPLPFIAVTGEFVRVIVLTAAIAAIYTFCAVCCNTVLDSAIFTLAFNFIVPAYTVLFVSLMHEYLEGFVSGGVYTIIAMKLSPICMLYQCFIWEELPYTLLSNIIYMTFTALVLFAACRLYVKRRSEKAQSNNINGLIYRFILLAASVGGGAFFGFVISEGFGWAYSFEFTTIALGCVFSAVIYLIFSTVTSRRVNPGKKGVLWLAAGVVLTAGIFASMMTGFFGFETYLPIADDIASVKIFYGGEYESITRYVKQPDGKYKYVYGANGGVVFEKPEEIAVIYNMHRKIVEAGFDKESDQSIYHGFEVQYTLKNGRTVERNYYRVPAEIVKDYMLVDDLETFKYQIIPMLISPASDLDHFVIKDGFGQNQQVLNLTESETELLYNAIAQDVLNRTSQMKKQHNEISLAKISLRYKSVKSDDRGVAIAENFESAAVVADAYHGESTIEYEMYSNVCFEVCESSINTIKALKELGLEQYTTLTQPQNMKAIVALDVGPYYSNRSANFWMTSANFDETGFADQINWQQRNMAYYDEEQIAQIADACTSIVYSPAVADEEVFAVVFAPEDADLRYVYENQIECICYYMPYSQAPQFIIDGFVQNFGEI